MKGSLLATIVLWCWLEGAVSLAANGAVARIGESGQELELTVEVEGRTITERLPLNRAGVVRYFSAGIGLEERAAEYPPFPLKLVFTAGGKPYLSRVAVTIQPAKGQAITIPREHVNGPWLFVDLTPGTYHVKGIYAGQEQGVEGIVVEAGRQETVHLRWPEDRGVFEQLPIE